MRYIEPEDTQHSRSVFIRNYKRYAVLSGLKQMRRKVSKIYKWIDYNLEMLLTYNNKMFSSTTK